MAAKKKTKKAAKKVTKKAVKKSAKKVSKKAVKKTAKKNSKKVSMTTVTLGGNKVSVSGKLPKVGSRLPKFALTTGTLSEIGNADIKGKRVISTSSLRSTRQHAQRQLAHLTRLHQA